MKFIYFIRRRNIMGQDFNKDKGSDPRKPGQSGQSGIEQGNPGHPGQSQDKARKAGNNRTDRHETPGAPRK